MSPGSPCWTVTEDEAPSPEPLDRRGTRDRRDAHTPRLSPLRRRKLLVVPIVVALVTKRGAGLRCPAPRPASPAGRAPDDAHGPSRRRPGGRGRASVGRTPGVL